MPVQCIQCNNVTQSKLRYQFFFGYKEQKPYYSVTLVVEY